jgi:hypothetical protein
MSKEASATPAPGQPKRHLNSTVRARERLCSSFLAFAVADMVDYLTTKPSKLELDVVVVVVVAPQTAVAANSD